MLRIARGVVNEGYFHIVDRGNHQQTLFHQPEEFALFFGAADSIGGEV